METVKEIVQQILKIAREEARAEARKEVIRMLKQAIVATEPPRYRKRGK